MPDDVTTASFTLRIREPRNAYIRVAVRTEGSAEVYGAEDIVEAIRQMSVTLYGFQADLMRLESLGASGKQMQPSYLLCCSGKYTEKVCAAISCVTRVGTTACALDIHCVSTNLILAVER